MLSDLRCRHPCLICLEEKEVVRGGEIVFVNTALDRKAERRFLAEGGEKGRFFCHGDRRPEDNATKSGRKKRKEKLRMPISGSSVRVTQLACVLLVSGGGGFISGYPTEYSVRSTVLKIEGNYNLHSTTTKIHKNQESRIASATSRQKPTDKC